MAVRMLFRFAIVFSIALVVRFATTHAWFNTPERLYAPDSVGYDRLALNLLRHGAFSQSAIPPYAPDSHRTPGYPIFLAIVYRTIGHNPLAVIAVQDLIDSINAMLVYAIAGSVTTPQGAMIAGLGYAFAPLLIFQAQRLLTETLFVFFMLIALLCGLNALVRSSRSLLISTAISCALATLVRPIGMGLAVMWLLAFVFMTYRCGLRLCLLRIVQFIGAYIAPLLPWLIRNYITFHMLFLCTGHQLAFVYYNAAATWARVRGITLEEAQMEIFNRAQHHFIGIKGAPAIKPLDVWQPAIQDPRNVQVLLTEAWHVVRSHPKEAISVHLEGFVHYLFMALPIRDVLANIFEVADEMLHRPIRQRFMHLVRSGSCISALRMVWRERLQPLPWSARLLWFYSMLFTLVIEGLAFASVRSSWRAGGQSRTIVIMGIAMIAYLLISPGPQLEPRFRAVAEPWFIIMAAMAIVN
ncbi:MAG TPA: hypothetical protein EYP10_03900, partial [Armatimonadetes bacterium]|nr:hypothetical protein [Armatimonadota bacterium]